MNEFAKQNPIIMGVILFLVGILGVFLMWNQKKDTSLLSKSHTFGVYMVSIIFIIFGLFYILELV